MRYDITMRIFREICSQLRCNLILKRDGMYFMYFAASSTSSTLFTIFPPRLPQITVLLYVCAYRMMLYWNFTIFKGVQICHSLTILLSEWMLFQYGATERAKFWVPISLDWSFDNENLRLLYSLLDLQEATRYVVESFSQSKCVRIQTHSVINKVKEKIQRQ